MSKTVTATAKKVPAASHEAWIAGRREVVTLVRRQSHPFAAGVLRGEVSKYDGKVSRA